MMDISLFLLLFLAVAAGWLMGRLQLRRGRAQRLRDHFSEAYFLGLSQLIDNQTDQAIDNFVSALKHDAETVPLRIALGTLFRRRGEVQRATELHQAVLTVPELSPRQSRQAQLALSEDYLAAGLLDRAEALLEGLLQSDDRETQLRAVSLLWRLQERSGDWQKALDLAVRFPPGDSRMRRTLAHYCCELAEQAIANQDEVELQGRLKQALGYDIHCVRATLLLSEQEMAASRWKNALKNLKRIPEQDARFVSEAIPRLVRCYQELNDVKALRQLLEQYASRYPSASGMLAIAELIAEEGGGYQAASYLTDQLKRHPCIRMFNRLIDFHLSAVEPSARESLVVLRGLSGQLMQTKPVYYCRQCGFSGRTLHWLCPSCRHWGEITPVQGLEGE